MVSKRCRAWTAVLILGATIIAGCGKPADKGAVKTPEGPLPNTTDSK